MPLHDWTRVGDWLYHQQQLGWVWRLSGWLNNNLPADYYAQTELGHRMRSRGDPVEVVRIKSEAEYYHRKRRTVAVRRAADHGYAALVEVTSPGVTSTRRRLGQFTHKLQMALQHGIHVLLIDPFPPSRLAPDGLHAAVWQAVTGRRFEPPPGEPITLASYAAGPEVRAIVRSVAAGDVLPDMPLLLDADAPVSVPLEATYQEGYEGFPKPLRPMVEGGPG